MKLRSHTVDVDHYQRLLAPDYTWTAPANPNTPTRLRIKRVAADLFTTKRVSGITHAHKFRGDTLKTLPGADTTASSLAWRWVARAPQSYGTSHLVGRFVYQLCYGPLATITTLAHGSWAKYAGLPSILKQRAATEQLDPSLVRTSTGVDYRCRVCKEDVLGTPTHALTACPHTLTAWKAMVATVSSYMAGLLGGPVSFWLPGPLTRSGA